MSKKLFILCSCLSILCAIGCVKESTETTTEFKSSDIPSTIPYKGGTYTLSLEKVVVKLQPTKTNTDIAWAYRVNYDGVKGKSTVFDEASESVKVTIAANHTACTKDIVIEFSSDNEKTWKEVAKATQEADPAKIKDVFSDFGSTDMPEKVSYNGGDFSFKLKFREEDPVLKSAPLTTFIPWSYRIVYDGVAQEAVKVEEKTEQVGFHIEPNYTENKKSIAIEIANDKDTDKWTAVATAEQEAALVELGEDGISYFYAKSDLTVKDGKFALASAPEETGCFFRHGSKFAVPADETYAGFAYSPDKTQIALGEIVPDAGEDPCTALSPDFRMPSYEELQMLYYLDDTENTAKVNGVNGSHHKGTDLFLPFGGYVNIASGSLMGKNSVGAWWGLGNNYNGNGLVLTSNLEYSAAPSYDFMGENLASVRCVKNIKLPAYVSHEPTTIETCKETPITVVTNPGDFQLYEVALESEKGNYTQTGATNNKTTITIKLPENEYKEDVKWKLFVNSIYTGVTFTQPAMKDYVIFMSYAPQTAQEYKSFKLSVNVDTDRDDVVVKAVGSNGKEVSGNVSKDKPVVELTIPENTEHAKVIWTIYVDGESTKKTVEQGPAPVASLSVDWSTGFLTLKDGKYVFADPMEKGAYFTWKSKYAITSVPYSGKAYGPEETSFAKMADIPHGDTDPCSLVAPAGTWRMPSEAEVNELTACRHVTTSKKNMTFTLPDGSSLTFVVGGQVSGSTGKGMLLDATSVFWTADNHATDATKAKYALFSTTTDKASVSAGVVKTNGQQIRCVKSH